MADTLGPDTPQIAERLAEFDPGPGCLSPLDVHARMDAIRQIAADNGL